MIVLLPPRDATRCKTCRCYLGYYVPGLHLDEHECDECLVAGVVESVRAAMVAAEEER